MLIGCYEWKIGRFVTGCFTHMAEITCPYGTMPLNRVVMNLSIPGKIILDYRELCIH